MNAATIRLAGAAHALLADGFELHLASSGPVLAALDTAPLQLPIATIDCLGRSEARAAGDSMLLIYNRLNQEAFGPAGIALPRWVMVDLGLLPSAFLLISLPLARVAELARDPAGEPAGRAILRALLAQADALAYAGPVPVAGYCASPAAAPGDWVGWSLCSALRGRGLATTAKAVALCVYRPCRLIGVTQYGNRAMTIHRRFGATRLLAATMTLHTAPGSLVYETDLQAPDPDSDTDQPAFSVGPHDTERQRQMQQMLDARSHELHILRPGVDAAGRTPVLARPVA